MILTKEMLSKSLKKGRQEAVYLLNKLSQLGRLPEPQYEYSAGGNTTRRSHFYKLRFRIPQFLIDEGSEAGGFFESNVVHGAGRCSTKQFAKSLAALEAVHRIEELMEIERGSLQKRLDEYLEEQLRKQDEFKKFPITQELPGVSWENIPIDLSFSETLPARRLGKIEFCPAIVHNPDAFLAAKAITLDSKDALPVVAIHANQTDTGILQRWANIRASGRIGGVVGALPLDTSMGVDNHQATILALEAISHDIRSRKHPSVQAIVAACERGKDSSFGMAKLFVSLPKHQFQDLKCLLDKVKGYEIDIHRKETQMRHRRMDRRPSRNDGGGALKARLASFRSHQKKQPLPVDSVEKKIPHDAAVTIVRGGTGSGKTTRYPLMLSLFSPTGTSTRIVVAQPRRLACQTAARRVAYEQGFQIGAQGCPIGYAIRFESILSSADSRTIDFQTPGVLLRRAAEDPLLSDVTHLCIDEIHERNADMDLLLALAKQALRRRANHKKLPPLRLVLMSATLDSSQWESYFRDDDRKISVAVVDVPDFRRFPITTVHLGDGDFPLQPNLTKRFQQQRNSSTDCDEAICMTMAALACRLFNKNDLDGGSILCFLPGMEEIRRVHRYIHEHSKRKRAPKVIYLHSSMSSGDQAKAFEPGQKIILATNIAETSVTIPDCKIVIDSGRERQFSLLDSSSVSDSVTVVGSQLVTVNISQASAKQRAGRAGRVSAGTCYRLYSQNDLETEFPAFTTPEMLRMDLSQLVLHSISLYHPTSGHPLSLLLGAPDPPTETRLQQTVRGLFYQGLVDHGDDNGFADFDDDEAGGADHPTSLTPLGRAVNDFPVEPRIGRMLFIGLVLRAIDPALTIAALLSVPKVFSPPSSGPDNARYAKSCSDIVVQLEDYHNYIKQGKQVRESHPKALVLDQVTRVRKQLEWAMKKYLHQHSKNDTNMKRGETNWNANSNRVAALVGLICSATPHIAHLVNSSADLATRDVAGTAKIHPTSVNFDKAKRAHWYVYHELRATKAPYLHTTTAASPLELALFSDASSPVYMDDSDGDEEQQYKFFEDLYGDDNWLFNADQWVPVVVSEPSQRDAFVKLRRLLLYDMLQQVAQDPSRFASDPSYEQIVLFVLSALEQQRLSK